MKNNKQTNKNWIVGWLSTTKTARGGGMILDDAAIAVVSVENFEFSVDGRADGGRLLLGHEVPLGFPSRHFDSRSVDEERVVQNHEIVIQDAQCVTLSHFI